MQVSPMQWEAFFAVVKRACGLDLSLYKQDQLQRRVGSMVEQRGLSTLEEFGRMVTSSDKDKQWFLDKLAINVSELFRNPEKWRELEERILPYLLTRSNKLKCWSAGCSFGAEAYSLATLFEAKFKGPHTILGTDIDLAALGQAKNGEFCQADVRGVPKPYLEGHFEKIANGFRAKDALRRYVTFRTGNLLADKFDGGYDLILCRNVVIYFTEPAKDELYARFLQALKPGGILFVGSTERIFKAKELGFESPIPFFYQRPLEGATKQWRNAS